VGLRQSIADNKGCYPGQEVIEKIISLGAPARRIALIEGQGPAPRPGDAIFNVAEPATEVGQVTSVSAVDGRYSAIGMIRKIHAKDGLEVKLASDGRPARIVRVAPYA
jgi:aminomethyltransferase